MGEGDISELATPSISIVGSETISRLNSEGFRESWKPLQIVGVSREAMHRMPAGKSGIVIGSGGNTEKWKEKGWKTLDLNPKAGADITADANLMEAHISPASQDFIFAEYVTFDLTGNVGVQPARLLQQANKALNMGGYLIIQTASFENVPKANTPQRQEFAELMTQHGFDTVVEVSTYDHLGENKRVQQVIHYGRKIAEGFDRSRLPKEDDKPVFDPQTGKPMSRN